MGEINGVFLTPLKQIKTPKGDVWHAMKKSDDGFAGFGEAYFSFVDKGAVKGWKKHKEMTLNLVVILGVVKFRLIDDREESKTKGIKKEFTLSPQNYYRLTVAPGVWVCFEGLGEQNMLINLADMEHNPSESEVGSLPDEKTCL